MLLVVALWLFLNEVVAEWLDTIDLFLSYVQIASVINDFNDVQWPGSMQAFLRVFSYLDFDVDVVSLGCSTDHRFSIDFTLQLLLPLVVSGLFFPAL